MMSGPQAKINITQAKLCTNTPQTTVSIFTKDKWSLKIKNNEMK